MNEALATGGSSRLGGLLTFGGAAAFFALALLAAFMFAVPAYSRYQSRMNADNETAINSIKIQQTEQMVQVERQRAQIRIVEAEGISQAQKIINATLSDKYLQHEAINAQEKMANSPNHTTIYIPSGTNGIPLVKTVDEPQPSPEKKD